MLYLMMHFLGRGATGRQDGSSSQPGRTTTTASQERGRRDEMYRGYRWITASSTRGATFLPRGWWIVQTRPQGECAWEPSFAAEFHHRHRHRHRFRFPAIIVLLRPLRFSLLCVTLRPFLHLLLRHGGLTVFLLAHHFQVRITFISLACVHLSVFHRFRRWSG